MVDSARPTLEDFFEHIAHSNPFQINRVDSPTQRAVDVQAIHRDLFEELVNLANAALRNHTGLGALVWGEPGIGKSHLLTRLCRWADQHSALYVFLHNLQCSPATLPRYILKTVVSRLTRGRTAGLYDTHLYHLVSKMVSDSIKTLDPSATGKLSWSRALSAYRSQVEDLIGEDPSISGDDDRLIYDVLFQFFYGSYRAHKGRGSQAKAELAVRWLKGDRLDAGERQALKIPDPYPDDEEQDLEDPQIIEKILVALAQLSRNHGQPFILFFDQVDNMDEDQVKVLFRFLHALIDHAPNLFVIVSGVERTLREFKEQGIISQSNWDRFQEHLTLRRIREPEARTLVKSRLEDFFQRFVDILAYQQVYAYARDPLFPLSTPWLNTAFTGKPTFRPRDVINWCRERWREEQRALVKSMSSDRWLESWPHFQPGPPGPPKPPIALIDETVEHKLKAQATRRELEPEGLPPDASNLCGLVSSLLQQCLHTDHGYSIRALERLEGTRHSGRKPTYDLRVQELREGDGAEIDNGVAFIVTGNGFSITASLRRIHDDKSPPDHVMVVWDERQPLKLGKKGREYLKALKQRGEQGFKLYRLAFPDYIRLDALQAVVGEARSGDLEADLPDGTTRAISADEVIHSHHRRDRYRSHPLLHGLLTEGPLKEPQVPEPTPGNETELQQFIMAQLALTVGQSSQELTIKYLHAHRQEGDEAACRRAIEQVAKQMHQAGKINVTPLDDQLYMLIG